MLHDVAHCLQVLIGGQINQKNASDLMKMWDKGGDGIVTKQEFQEGLVAQKIETSDSQIDRQHAPLSNLGATEAVRTYGQLHMRRSPLHKPLRHAVVIMLTMTTTVSIEHVR